MIAVATQTADWIGFAAGVSSRFSDELLVDRTYALTATADVFVRQNSDSGAPIAFGGESELTVSAFFVAKGAVIVLDGRAGKYVHVAGVPGGSAGVATIARASAI